MLCNSSWKKMPKQRNEAEGRFSESTSITYSRLLPLLKSTYLSLLVSLHFGQEMPEMLVSSWKHALTRTGVKLCMLNIYFSCTGGKKLSPDRNQEVSWPLPPPPPIHRPYILWRNVWIQNWHLTSATVCRCRHQQHWSVMYSVVTEYLDFSHTSSNHRWYKSAFLDGLVKKRNFVSCGFITT